MPVHAERRLPAVEHAAELQSLPDRPDRHDPAARRPARVREDALGPDPAMVEQAAEGTSARVRLDAGTLSNHTRCKCNDKLKKNSCHRHYHWGHLVAGLHVNQHDQRSLGSAEEQEDQELHSLLSAAAGLPCALRRQSRSNAATPLSHWRQGLPGKPPHVSPGGTLERMAAAAVSTAPSPIVTLSMTPPRPAVLT